MNTIIIGAGPGGASAAIYLARFCHQVTVIDAGEKVPGRTSMATGLRNFLGHTEPVSGSQFLTKIKEQLETYNIKIQEEKVIKVSKNLDDSFTVETDKPAQYSAKYL